MNTPRRRALLALLPLFTLLSSPAQAAVPTTVLTLSVSGCSGCSITVIQPDAQGAHAWSRHSVIRHGKAVLTIPRARTHGMYVVVGRPEGAVISDGAGARVAVSRYPRFKPGATVTARQAANGKRAYHCWAGTSKARATLHLYVTRFAAKDAYSGKSGFDIRVFMSPTVASVGHAQATYRGTLGAQDFFSC